MRSNVYVVLFAFLKEPSTVTTHTEDQGEESADLRRQVSPNPKFSQSHSTAHHQS